MAQLFNGRVYNSTPYPSAEVNYEYQRSGNNMQYRFTGRIYLESSGGWYYNNLQLNLYLNGSWIYGKDCKSSSTGWSISFDSGWVTVSNKISGTTPFYFTVKDTQNSSWTNYTSGTYNLAVITPSAPSVPSAITIPSSIAPDQTASISWNASSGGTNGVSGYQLAYSKDGGSSWTYVDVSGTSYSLNLNSAGFVHGSVLKCAVRSYSTVAGTRFYSDWRYSGTTTTSFVAPSTPSSVSIPSSIAPDKTASISWSAASGGTNGVKGYAYQWSKDGGSTWSTEATTTATSLSLDLNANGFVHGSKLAFRVRSYTTGQNANYYSSYKTSSTTTTSFIAPSAPQSQKISYDMSEPIPTGTYKAAWSAPSNTGSNGISGYRVQWLKNGSAFGDEYDVSGTSASKATTESTITPGDTISFKVRAYTIGQNTRYYSDYVTSGTITIVSDKFIYVSQNGGSFIKYKAYISVNGGSFVEIKKEKLKVIK
ncbi:MAG: hypothetical protein ACI3T9_01210 [Romboutsia timonensis]